MKKILVMETGSFRVFGGAAKTTYEIYLYLKEFKPYKVDLFGEFSKIDKNARPISEDAIGKTNYDIIIMNSIRDFPVVFRNIRYWKAKKPIFLYTDRGNVLLNFRNARIKRLLPKMIARQYLITKMKGLLDCYVALSAEQAEYARHFFPRSAMIRQIPIAPGKNFKKLKVVKQLKSALYVGRLDERQKKVMFLIKGVELAKNAHKLGNSELLRIVGHGSHEDTYKRYVGSRGLNKNITFVGFVSEGELLKMYNSSAFFVSASEWEGMSGTFVEAMACGQPLLVNDKNNTIIGYNPKQNLVKEGYNGMVYEYGNLNDFANKFYRLYSDKKLRNRLADNAYTFSKRFNIDKNLSAYKKIIDKL